MTVMCSLQHLRCVSLLVSTLLIGNCFANGLYQTRNVYQPDTERPEIVTQEVPAAGVGSRAVRSVERLTPTGARSDSVPEYEYYYDDYYYYTDPNDVTAQRSRDKSSAEFAPRPYTYSTAAVTRPASFISSVQPTEMSTVSKFKLTAAPDLITDYITTITGAAFSLSSHTANLTLTQSRTVLSSTRTTVVVSLVPVVVAGITRRTLSLTQTYRVTSTVDAIVTISVDHERPAVAGAYKHDITQLINEDLDPTDHLLLSASEPEPQQVLAPNRATPPLPPPLAAPPAAAQLPPVNNLQQTLGQMALLQLLAPYIMQSGQSQLAAAGGDAAVGVGVAGGGAMGVAGGGAMGGAGVTMQTVINSSPVYITTTYTTTHSTPVLVTYQAKRSTNYIRSTELVSAVITTHSLTTTLVPHRPAFPVQFIG